MRLIDADDLIRSIEISPYNDYDDFLRTLRLIDDAPTEEPRTEEPRFSYNDLEAMIICGYPVKDLIILAQRIHSDGLDPQTLRNSNEDYIAGYKRAYEESNKALEDAINKMVDNIPKDL